MVNLIAGDVGRLPAAASVSSTDTALVYQNGTLVRATPAQIATGGGDVVGPASSVDNAIATFSGITGKLLATPPTITASSGTLNVGASGTAGTVGVFAGTAAKGKVTITTSDNTGNTTTNINVAAQAAARTLTIPDGGQSTANVLLSEGAQTINGVQTFTAPQVRSSGTTITAFAGGGQGSATALVAEYNNVTTVASNFDSVKLLTAVTGLVQTVKNNGAAILAVFPNTGNTINGLAANLSIDIPVGGEVTFRAVSATSWQTMQTIDLNSPSTQKGNLVIKAADSAGNTQTLITNASQAAARTYTIPDAGANDTFTMNAATQTITNKTISTAIYSDIKSTTGAVTANANTTYANVTGLSTTVVPGTYRFRCVLPSTVASGTGGIKYCFAYTTTVLTSIEATGIGYTSAAVAVQHTTTTTSQTDLFTQAAVVIMTILEGTMVVSTGGTVAVQMAQNTSNASNTVALVGGSMDFTRIA